MIIPDKRPDLMLINKKKNFHLRNFAIPVDHREKIKESERNT